MSINSSGVIAGYYNDTPGLSHAFLRAADGTLTVFDAPGVGCQYFPPPALSPPSINLSGAVTGHFVEPTVCITVSFARQAAHSSCWTVQKQEPARDMEPSR
jgi:hypothetical protein